MVASHDMRILGDIVHLKRGQWHLFFRPKTLAWALMDELGAAVFADFIRSTPVPEIVAKLAQEFDVPLAEIAGEIQRFLKTLQIQGLFEDPPKPCICSDDPRPRSLYLHVTSRCNLSCIYCYNRKARKSWSDDMSLSLAQRVLVQAKELGVSTLILTGGEPLLNPHLCKIAGFGKSLNLRIVLLTNGTLIDKARAKELADLCDQIVVSLDSSIPAIHESLRGQGTHGRAERAIQHLKEVGAKEVVASAVITRCNQLELFKDLEQYAKQIGADRAVRQIYMLQGDERDQVLVPNFQMLQTQMEEDLENMVASGIKLPPTDGVWRNRCGAAFGEIAVGPDGAVYPCQGLVAPEFNAGNVAESDLREIWEGSETLASVRAITVEDLPRCRECLFRYLCGGGCRALAYTVHRSLTMPIPEEYCAFNRILAEQRLWAEALYSLASPETQASSSS